MAKGKQTHGFLNIKKLLSFAKKNYFITIIVLCVLFVGVVSVYKLFFSKPTFIYAKVKVGQGLWWANTMRPNIWFVNAIKNAGEEKDLVGRPITELLGIRHYRYWGGNFDTYITAKLHVSKLGETGKYNFKRSTIGIGTSIDFEFPKVQFSGTIMDLSEYPIEDKYIEKTIYLTKKYAYLWEYDSIPIGDTYFDGKEIVFTLLNKQLGSTNEAIKPEIAEWVNSQSSEPRNYIMLKAKVKLKQEDGHLIFGEEQVITRGNGLYVVTSRFAYNEYVVTKVE